MCLNNFDGFTSCAGFVTESRWSSVWSCGIFCNFPGWQRRELHTSVYLVPYDKSTAHVQSSCGFITINTGVNGTLMRQWTFIQTITWLPVGSIGLTAVQQRSKKTIVHPGSTKCNACVQGWATACAQGEWCARLQQHQATHTNSATPELPAHASSLLVQGCKRRKAWDPSKKAARS